MGECGESVCIAATGIPSVRCAESPARLSGCVTEDDTLYWVLVDRESLQPIAISTIDAQETPSPPEGCLARIGKGESWAIGRTHRVSTSASQTVRQTRMVSLGSPRSVLIGNRQKDKTRD
jgi:hypothetical protein